MTTQTTEVRIRKNDLREVTLAEGAMPALASGAVRLRIERFALTANNITYAAFGEAMAYWNFFPTAAGFGLLPVWGFAMVEASDHPEISVGERLYGYFPMAHHVDLLPSRVSASAFIDVSTHRAQLPAAYQRYRRISADAQHDPSQEDEQALLWPLFMTSFLIEDFLNEHDLFGADTIVLSSASSKTALGIAACARQRAVAGRRVLGLTSAANLAFCRRTGDYDDVLTYEQLTQVPAQTHSVFVDMAGNGRLLHDLHHHFGEHLRYSCMVGGTHWEARETQHGLPGAKPTFFFAPHHIRKRQQDWGPGGVDQRFAEAWARFLPSLRRWLRIQRTDGATAIIAAYREVLEGRIDPQDGLILGWSGDR